MNLNLVNEITKSQMRNDLPEIKAGMTIRVDVKIKEGNKERIVFMLRLLKVKRKESRCLKVSLSRCRVQESVKHSL